MVGPRIPAGRSKRLKAPVFPGYNVIRELASGGMGVVYEAYHRATGVRVAIKTMRLAACSNDLERRFLGEVVASQRIDHPSVVHVFDFGRDQARSPFLVMEYLDGEPLSDRAARRDLTPDEFCDIARQLVSVLAAAHQAGILHRDVKPANVILLEDPDRPGNSLVKLIDFGIAKFVHDDAFTEGTAAGVLVGTPAYMSPEQCLGGGLDERSDIYATGCLLYELLGNRPPFVGSVADVLIAQRSRRPPPIASINPAVPARLANLVDRMLSKRPSERPRSMAEVSAELALLRLDRRGPAPASQSYAAIPRRIRSQKRKARVGPWQLASLFAAAISAGAAAAMLTQL